MMKRSSLAALALLAAGAVFAKLPPVSDEAKAKAAEAAAKTAWANKVAGFQLCRSMDRVATSYQAAARKAGKPASAPAATPACADPGPFAYTPAPAAAATPAPAAPVAKK
jgi:hypothetical protein